MENPQEFIRAINKARVKAARFYKVDLHIHSHESPDYPKLGDKENCSRELIDKDKSPLPEDYISAAMKVKDLKVIAITDHNKSRISAEIAKFSRDNNCEIVILPAMEVSLQITLFRDSIIHVLTIFPEHFSSEDIQGIFPVNCELPPYEERDENAIARVNLEEFIETVHKKGGICIAGHVNSDKGARSFFRESNTKLLKIRQKIKELKQQHEKDPGNQIVQNELEKFNLQNKELEDWVQDQFLELLSTYKFDAVEVQKSSDTQFYSGVHTDLLGLRDIPCVLGSDAHNLGDIGLEGSITYVKMTKPGFRDLEKALKDPGTRIRFEDTIKPSQYPRILGMRFDGQFFQNHVLGFSDNLNCLIGGRGTGKSAVIEALRKVFDHDLSHLGNDKRKDIQGRKEHTLTDTKIEVLFTDQNEESVILIDEAGAETKCYALNGDLLTDIKVAVASNLKVKIYGWGEIEELARNKREQLKLIDGFIPESLSRKNSIIDKLIELEENTQQIISSVSEIEELLPRIVELPSKESALERLSSDELDDIFEDFDRNENAESSIEVLISEFENLAKKIKSENGSSFEFSDGIEQAVSTAEEGIKSYEWVSEFTTQILLAGKDIQVKYSELLGQFVTITNIASEKIQALGFERAAIERELTKIANESPENANGNDIANLINQRRRLTEEVSDLKAIRTQINDKQERVFEKLSYRFNELIPALNAERRNLTKLRKIKIREINRRLDALSNVAKVSVKLLHQKEREQFRLALGAPEPKMPDGVFKNINNWYKKDNYAGLYAERHSPHTFVQAIINPEPEYKNLLACVEKDGVIQEVINNGRASKVFEHLSPNHPENDVYYSSKKLDDLLRLEHIDTEDLPIICLDGQPIEELSPGQRCSSLIPIILLESNCPLIIDQPEDNLDNKLVFDLVVDILRCLKEQRQIIVATHNPNIPVSGDAEQIMVFDAPSRDRCIILEQGSIDDSGVINQIKTIMEGSEDAFRIRAEKYGYRLN